MSQKVSTQTIVLTLQNQRRLFLIMENRISFLALIVLVSISILGCDEKASEPSNSSSSEQQKAAENLLLEPKSQTVSPADVQNTKTLRLKDLAPFQLDALRQQGIDVDKLDPNTPLEDAPKSKSREEQNDSVKTPPELKNSIIYLDDFLGGGKVGFPADVISIKKGALKFRLGGKDYDYSGNFSILLMTPRLHSNPYFGFKSTFANAIHFRVVSHFNQCANFTLLESDCY